MASAAAALGLAPQEAVINTWQCMRAEPAMRPSPAKAAAELHCKARCMLRRALTQLKTAAPAWGGNLPNNTCVHVSRYPGFSACMQTAPRSSMGAVIGRRPAA